MNLIFIYGPPASGKLTVAEELEKALGYKVFHNHTIINAVTTLFPFENPVYESARKHLTRKIRLDIFAEAAKAQVSFITTFGGAGSTFFEFYYDTQKVVEAAGGTVHFVQLKPSKEALMQRVEQESRTRHQKIDSKDVLEQRLNKQPESFDKLPGVEHLTIDNTNLTPSETAKKIIDYYKLSS